MKRAKQRVGAWRPTTTEIKGLPRYVPEKDEVLWWDHDDDHEPTTEMLQLVARLAMNTPTKGDGK